MTCKAKKFQDRMSHRRDGKAVGERGIGSGSIGKSAGETSAMSRQILTPKAYPHAQSKDGNGGK